MDMKNQKGADELADVKEDCWNRAVEEAKSMPLHSKGVLRIVEEGTPLEQAFGGLEDQHRYQEAFNTLLTCGYIEFDGWIPRLSAKGKFARKYGSLQAPLPM